MVVSALTSVLRAWWLAVDGVISKDEFRQGMQALATLQSNTITDGQADEMLPVLDVNGDGQIDWAEFVGAFRLVDSGAKHGAHTADAAGVVPNSPVAGRLASPKFGRSGVGIGGMSSSGLPGAQPGTGVAGFFRVAGGAEGKSH